MRTYALTLTSKGFLWISASEQNKIEKVYLTFSLSLLQQSVVNPCVCNASHIFYILLIYFTSVLKYTVKLLSRFIQEKKKTFSYGMRCHILLSNITEWRFTLDTCFLTRGRKTQMFDLKFVFIWNLTKSLKQDTT